MRAAEPAEPVFTFDATERHGSRRGASVTRAPVPLQLALDLGQQLAR